MEGEPIVALVYGGLLVGFGVNELVRRDQMARRAHLSFLAGGIVIAWGFWGAF